MALKNRMMAAKHHYEKMTSNKFIGSDLARYCDVSKMTVSAWFSGKSKSIDGENLVNVANFLKVNSDWLATGQGSMTNNGNINISGGTIHGNQTINNLNQTVMPEDAEAFQKNMSLQEVPMFDIDDGVAYALHQENKDILVERAGSTSTFVRDDARTFAVKLDKNIHGITPSVLNANDVLIIEPSVAPTDGDLVLICLGYPHTERGVIAKYILDIHNNDTIKHSEAPAEPLPVGSVICGVVVKVERYFLDGALLRKRLNKDWDILNTLKKADIDDD